MPRQSTSSPMALIMARPPNSEAPGCRETETTSKDSQGRSSFLSFLYAFLLMTRIPFLPVVFALVTLQVLFPTLTRLLKSPLGSGIISTFAISLVLCFHNNSTLCLFFWYPRLMRQVSKQDAQILFPSLFSAEPTPCSTTTCSEY